MDAEDELVFNIKEKPADLGELLKQFYTDEARARFVELCEEKGNLVPAEYLEKAIYWYENAGKVDKAASIAKKHGWKKEVITIFEREGLFESAAMAAEEYGFSITAQQLYARACVELEKKGDFGSAATIACVKLQDYEKSHKLCLEEILKAEKIGDFAYAHQIAYSDEQKNLLQRQKGAKKKAELFDTVAKQYDDGIVADENAIAVYRQLGRIDDAVKVAEKLGLYELGVEIYESIKRYANAGIFAEKALNKLKTAKQENRIKGLIQKAIENYEKAKWYDSASSLASKEGLTERVIQIYENAENLELHNKAIYVALNAGRVKTALEICERLGKYKSAKLIAENSGRIWRQRAEFYRSIEDYISNADWFYPITIKNPKQKKKEYKHNIGNDFKGIGDICIGLGYLAKKFLCDLCIHFATENISGLIKGGIITAGTLFTPFSGYYLITKISSSDKTPSQGLVRIAETTDCRAINKDTREGQFCRTNRWGAYITEAEQKYGIPNGMLAGLAMVESRGDPVVLNEGGDGSVGLFQIDKWVAQQYGMSTYEPFFITTWFRSYEQNLRKLTNKKDDQMESLVKYDDRFNPAISTEVAAKYLRDTHNKITENQRIDKKLAAHNAWDLTIAAYNVGINNAHAYVNNNGKYVKEVKKGQNYYLDRLS